MISLLKNRRVLVFLLIGLIILWFSLVGCSSFPLFLNPVPDWVRYTPEDSQGIRYFVGGPSNSLEDARFIALQEISGILHTQITSVSKKYVEVTYDELSRKVNDDFSQWIENESTSVLSGVRVDERWFDGDKEKWWILASVSEEDLSASFVKTADRIAEFNKEKKQQENIIISMLEPYVKKQHSSLAENLTILFEVYSYIDDLVFGSELIMIDGINTIHVKSFLENEINRLIDSLKIKKIIYYGEIIINEKNKISSIIHSDLYEEIGQLSWVVTSKNSKNRIVKNQSDGLLLIDIPPHSLPFGLQNIKIELDPSKYSLARFSKKNITRLPEETYTFQVIGGDLNLEVVSEYDVSDQLVSRIRALIADRLPFRFNEDVPSLTTLHVIIHTQPGADKQYDLCFLHVSFEFSVTSYGVVLLSEITEKEIGGGVDYDQALEKAFELQMEKIKLNDILFLKIEEQLLSVQSTVKEL